MAYDDRSGLGKFFGAFGKALLYLLVTFVYSLIGIAFAVGGSFLIGTNLIDSLMAGDFSVLLDPTAFFSNATSIIGFVLVILGFLFLILAGFAAFIFVSTRGIKFSEEVSFFGAFGAAFRILFGFILFIIILVGLSIGSLYIGNATIILVVNIVVYVFLALIPIAMMFRIVDFITDKI